MAGSKRMKTEYRNIYYNTETGKYDVKYNYKVYNASKQKYDYKAKWKYGIVSMEEAGRELQCLKRGENVRKAAGVTLQEAFEMWKNKAKAQDYSKMTIKNTEYYVKMLSEFISPDIRIEDITEEMYEELFSKCRDKYSDETIKTLNATFRKLINLAYKKRLIKEHPLARADNMKTKKTEKVRVITVQEWKKLDEYFSGGNSRDTTLRFMLHILYYTGIRIGECLALTWEDFEEFGHQATGGETEKGISSTGEEAPEQSGQRMRLNISKTILQDGTLKDTTKNKKNRKIPLSPEVIKLYADGCRTQSADRSERIFAGTYHRYICHITMACRKIGIPHCSCHSFRHTFISNLMRKGVPLPVIEKVSGDTQKTIFERYSHMFDDDEKLVLKALEDL